MTAAGQGVNLNLLTREQQTPQKSIQSNLKSRGAVNGAGNEADVGEEGEVVEVEGRAVEMKTTAKFYQMSVSHRINISFSEPKSDLPLSQFLPKLSEPVYIKLSVNFLEENLILKRILRLRLPPRRVLKLSLNGQSAAGLAGVEAAVTEV